MLDEEFLEDLHDHEDLDDEEDDDEVSFFSQKHTFSEIDY